MKDLLLLVVVVLVVVVVVVRSDILFSFCTWTEDLNLSVCNQEVQVGKAQEKDTRLSIQVSLAYCYNLSVILIHSPMVVSKVRFANAHF